MWNIKIKSFQSTYYQMFSFCVKFKICNIIRIFLKPSQLSDYKSHVVFKQKNTYFLKESKNIPQKIQTCFYLFFKFSFGIQLFYNMLPEVCNSFFRFLVNFKFFLFLSYPWVWSRQWFRKFGRIYIYFFICIFFSFFIVLLFCDSLSLSVFRFSLP